MTKDFFISKSTSSAPFYIRIFQIRIEEMNTCIEINYRLKSRAQVSLFAVLILSFIEKIEWN